MFVYKHTHTHIGLIRPNLNIVIILLEQRLYHHRTLKYCFCIFVFFLCNGFIEH